MFRQDKIFTFSKNERLKKKKLIEELILKGKVIKIFPFYVRFLQKPWNTFPQAIQITFTAGKKRFKKAVSRNRMKRLMREAYRLNKHVLTDLLNNKKINLTILVSYVDNKLIDFKTVEKNIIEILRQIATLIH